MTKKISPTKGTKKVHPLPPGIDLHARTINPQSFCKHCREQLLPEIPAILLAFQPSQKLTNDFGTGSPLRTLTEGGIVMGPDVPEMLNTDVGAMPAWLLARGRSDFPFWTGLAKFAARLLQRGDRQWAQIFYALCLRSDRRAAKAMLRKYLKNPKI